MDSQRVNLLMKDTIVYQETIQIVEEEAYAVREAWAYSIRLSQAVHSENQTHREYEIGERSTVRPTGDRGIDYEFISTLDAKARRRGIGEFGYGIRDTWVDPAETVPKIAPITVGEDSRNRIFQRVAMDSQRVNLLMKDTIVYQETIQIVEEEAYAVREAWAYSIRLSQAVHSENQTHRE
nr:hypothetical protein [Tanacetum cinerariifolium]